MKVPGNKQGLMGMTFIFERFSATDRCGSGGWLPVLYNTRLTTPMRGGSLSSP